MFAIHLRRNSVGFWVGKRTHVIVKPTNSPTQGQPNPTKISLKVAFGPLFSDLPNSVGFGVWKTYIKYYETDELPNPRPTQPKKNEVKSGIWASFSLTA